MMMPAKNNNVGLYKETVLQFGFLAMFSQAMPLIPLIGYFTNLLEIWTRFQCMCRFQRKVKGEAADGIGAWLTIVDTMTFMAIPVNAFIIYFCGDIAFETSGNPFLTNFLVGQDPELWTSRNILMLVVAVEHALIFLKFCLSAWIDDTPRDIQKEIKRMPKVEKRAEKFLKRIKAQNDKKGEKSICTF